MGPNNAVPKVKICGVCGDAAKTFHFGGLSCESCKSFFRRSVQTENYRTFYCVHQSKCIITQFNRKRCRSCRMNRCLAIGMDKRWVRTEAECQRLLKARAEKKISQRLFTIAFSTTKNQSLNTLLRPSSSSTYSSQIKLVTEYESQIERMTTYLSPLQMKDIESIVAKFSNMNVNVPFGDKLQICRNQPWSGDQITEVYGVICRRFSFFAHLLTEFSNLDTDDQTILLKNGMVEMAILRGAMVFDSKRNCWPSAKIPMYKEMRPILHLHDVAKITSPDVFRKHVDFIESIQKLEIDEPVIMLLVLIVLFNPERMNLKKPELIETTQSHYTTLLEQYVQWRYGSKRIHMFGKLMTKLCDLRELSDSYSRQLNTGYFGDEFWKNHSDQHLLNSFPYCSPHFDCALIGTNHLESEVSNSQRSIEDSHSIRLDKCNNYPSTSSTLACSNCDRCVTGIDYVKDLPMTAYHFRGTNLNSVNPYSVSAITPLDKPTKSHCEEMRESIENSLHQSCDCPCDNIGINDDAQTLNAIDRSVREDFDTRQITPQAIDNNFSLFFPKKLISSDGISFELDQNLSEENVQESGEFFQILEDFLQL